LSADSAAANRFSLTAGGQYLACGRGASVLGRGANLLLIDDVVKDREDAMSTAVRRATQEWYSSVAYTRLQPNAAVVLISTRWHLDDLPGWLLREHAQEGWEVLSLPAIAEQDEGWRRDGDPLWPKFWPLDALEHQKAMLGSAAFTALYQQRPIAQEGAIFKREWWRSYGAMPPAFDQIVMSADTAFQEKETADYSAVTVWGETKTGLYLLHVLRERLEFPALKRRLVGLAAEWRPNVVLIENRASGQSLIQELQRETSLPIHAVDVSKDKITRANAATPTVEAGRVYLPESAPWLEVYLDELSSFPAAPHDDLVDSTTMALNWIRRPAHGFSVEAWARAYGVTLLPVPDTTAQTVDASN
jgi:predicted phage terminase large subunit-like protein